MFRGAVGRGLPAAAAPKLMNAKKARWLRHLPTPQPAPLTQRASLWVVRVIKYRPWKKARRHRPPASITTRTSHAEGFTMRGTGFKVWAVEKRRAGLHEAHTTSLQHAPL
jgi:hypothetical protein